MAASLRCLSAVPLLRWQIKHLTHLVDLSGYDLSHKLKRIFGDEGAAPVTVETKGPTFVNVFSVSVMTRLSCL